MTFAMCVFQGFGSLLLTAEVEKHSAPPERFRTGTIFEIGSSK